MVCLGKTSVKLVLQSCVVGRPILANATSFLECQAAGYGEDFIENPFLGLAFRGGLCHTAVSSCRKRAGIEAAPLPPQTLPRFAR
jgi:hypothetical protein